MMVGLHYVHGCFQEGHFDVTEYLISEGAEVNRGDNDGRTALQPCCSRGSS